MPDEGYTMYRTDDFVVPDLPDNPTPEDRATYTVLRLEQFIREGRKVDEGMSFRKWQAMALTEIAANIADAENDAQKEEVPVNRLMFTASAAMVTIGFWGTAVSIHKVGYLAAGLICLVAGLAMLAVAGEWKFHKFWRRREADRRRTRLKHIESLNRKIRRLERDLEREAKDLEKALASTRKANAKTAPQGPPIPTGDQSEDGDFTLNP